MKTALTFAWCVALAGCLGFFVVGLFSTARVHGLNAEARARLEQNEFDAARAISSETQEELGRGQAALATGWVFLAAMVVSNAMLRRQRPRPVVR